MDGFSLSGMLVFIVKLIFAKLLFGGIMLFIKYLRKLFSKKKDVADNDNIDSDNSKKS